MNVRITPRGFPQRTELWPAVDRIRSDGTHLTLYTANPKLYCSVSLLQSDVAEIQLDEEPGDFF